MANTKYKSLEAIKASIRAGRKYAMENNTPEDPNETKVPAEDKSNIVTPADYSIPGGENKNTDNANEVIANTPLDQTLKADESDVKAPEKDPVKEEEKEVSIPEIPEEQKAENIKEASSKIKNALKDLVKKAKTSKASEPTVENVAEGIDLSSNTLSKIASMMLATEEGKQLAVKTLEMNKAEQIKQASLKELLIANELYKQEEMLRKTAAYKEAENSFMKVANAHIKTMDELELNYANDPEFAQAIKLAYAQGATDASAIQEGAQPVEQPTPEQEQADIMAVIQELIQAGQISPEQGQALAQLAQQVAMSDQNPELSPEEEQMLLQAAIEQGLLPQELLQGLMQGQPQAQPQVEQAPVSPEVAPDATAMQGDTATIADAQKTASVRKLASDIVANTYLIKKAAAEEGIIEVEEGVDPQTVEPSVEEIDNVINALVESGDLTPEDADAVKEEIAEAIVESEEGEISDEEAQALLDEVAAEEAVAEEAAASEGEEEEVTPEELESFLLEQGVTPEELESALNDISEEEYLADVEADA
jgi:DNA-binding transcriptional regulator YhcF (GntR family)